MYDDYDDYSYVRGEEFYQQDEEFSGEYEGDDVDEISENEEFERADEYYQMEDQHLDGMYEE